MRRNDKTPTLKTHELNEDYPIDEHKFVKQNGRLTFIHVSEIHSKFDEVNNEENDDANNLISYDENEQ